MKITVFKPLERQESEKPGQNRLAGAFSGTFQ
jgi:hypothetical protein